MDESRAYPSLHMLQKIWPQQWRDVHVLLLLLLAALAIRGCVVWMTEVPARDSIGFIRYALLFEKQDWQQVIIGSDQHPGYPLWLLAVSWPIRAWTGFTDCYTMQYSAQFASSLAGWLLVIPMFYLGKTLFNRTVGFWGALYFQVSPSSGQTLSDGISDPLFLFLAASALLMGVLAVKGNVLWRYAVCGIFCGLTYLVRPEGALILVAVGAVVVGIQFLPQFRRSWVRVFACGLALVMGGAVAGSPYFLVTGKFSNKPTVQKFVNELAPENLSQGNDAPAQAPLFAMHISTEGTVGERTVEGFKAVCTEFIQAYFYVGWLPFLLGLFWYRDRYRSNPGVYVVAAYFLLQGGIVWWLTVNAGYVSDRHILPLVIASISQVTAATMDLPFRIRRRLSKAESVEVPTNTRLFRIMAACSLMLMLLMVGAGLTRTLRPLHGHREGHHAAGVWLDKHTQPVDVIIDDHNWAHFYANRVFLEGTNPPSPPGHLPRRYVVYSRPKNQRLDTGYRRYHEEDILKMGGHPVYHWPEEADVSEAQVIVYQIGKTN